MGKQAKVQRMLTLLVGIASFACPSAVFAQDFDWNKLRESTDLSKFPEAFLKEPPPSPPYMVDNTRDTHGVAPVNGESNGAVWTEHGSLENYMLALEKNDTTGIFANISRPDRRSTSRGSSYWIPELAPLGVAPHAGAGYKFYRNVVDYGADPTGNKPAEEAINAAIQDGNRCGEECGNTFVQGALIYFPPGTYKICTPIIQYYYTQFVGDALDRPILKGCSNFTGIAMMDVDPYVPNMAKPDGTGVNWYINQNQFFRQIRNFVFDMTEMPAATDEHGQKLVPTGIHWQVSQACSLQNLLFKMPTISSSSTENITHVGVFTENGSGGFVSDLEFEGGAIGWRVGSQQYTATSLKFRNCITAVQMIWDWGFNWHKIDIEGGTIAFNISGRGGIDGQGVGSLSIIDSHISNVPIGILTNDHATQSPNIVIDNTVFNNVGVIVQAGNTAKLLDGGSQTIDLWAHGRRYGGKTGERLTGYVKHRPKRGSKLLDGGKLFTRLRPQYQDLPASSFLIATQHGCKSDGTGDNTDAINAFLKQAAASNKIAYFPAGIYSIQGTVNIPVGSKVQGTSWSQLQATGAYFQDIKNPKVAVRVGQSGDVGIIEIVDMLFTVKGNTAGAIMMEWNVHESTQGSAAMWDSHIRVGGGIGTDLDVAKCPKLGFSDACICVSLLLHVTKNGSGYFENVWAWVADHDNDMSLYWEVDSSASQISLYGARGILVESQGPCWFYGTGSEHVIYYQYQLYKAKDVYLGHLQTESPYFQPVPPSPKPFESSMGLFPGDPTFEDCKSDSCREAWGLRVIDSQGVLVHSAGLYSWFHNYGQGCLKTEDCQERIMEVKGSRDVALYNVFAKGVEQIATGKGYTIEQKDNQQGYTSEVSLWFPEDGDTEDDLEVVYIGTEVFQKPTAYCHKPCVLVLPPKSLSTTTTVKVGPYTTSLEVGTTTTTVTVTPKDIITNKIPYSNFNVTGIFTNGAIIPTKTSLLLDDVNVTVTFLIDGHTTSSVRKIQLPPWPQITQGPPDKWTTDTTAPTLPGGGTVTGKPGGSVTGKPSDEVTGRPSGEVTGKPSGTAPGTFIPETSTTSEIPFPTYTDYPIMTIEPITEDIEPQCINGTCHINEEDDSIKVKCDELWFFIFCINIKGLKVKGWKIWLPKGTIGPGPPPMLPDLPGWHINFPPPLPPWPRIRVGPGPALQYPDKNPSCDDNKISVPVEIYTRSYGLSVSSGTTVTTTTRTMTETVYDTGCPLPEYTSTAKCSVRAKRTVVPPGVASTEMPARPTLQPGKRYNIDAEWYNDNSCPGDELDAVIYLRDGCTVEDMNRARDRLGFDDEKFNIYSESIALPNSSPALMFAYVRKMPRSLREKFAVMPGIKIREIRYSDNRPAKRSNTRRSEAMPNESLQNQTTSFEARAPPTDQSLQWEAWHLSQISSHPGQAWDVDGDYIDEDAGFPVQKYYQYSAHGSKGEGQTIYLVESYVLNDPDFVGSNIRTIPGVTDIGRPDELNRHGTVMAKLIAGQRTGIVPKAQLVIFGQTHLQDELLSMELLMLLLLNIIQDVEENPQERKGRCVVNMSLGGAIPGSQREAKRELNRVMSYLENELGCVLVTASGNRGPGNPDTADKMVPAQFKARGQPNLLVASANGINGHLSNSALIWSRNQLTGLDFAPGLKLRLKLSNDATTSTGTSDSAALLSGLVAYYRALPSKWSNELRSPAAVRKMVHYLSRKVHVVNNCRDSPSPCPEYDENFDVSPFIIWNGNVGKENCLLEYTSELAKEVCDRYRANIPDSLESWQPTRVRDICEGVGKRSIAGRGLCDGNGGGAERGGFTWSEGAPSPTCKAGCGTLCTGYYCVPNPTGTPPDYDEQNPNLPTLTRTKTSDCVGQMKPTEVCNGSGGRAACVTSSYCSSYPFPTLTGTIDPSKCPETTTTSTFCNGSGGKGGCSVVTRCAPFPATFTTTEKTVSCYDPRDTCISTSYSTKCDKVARTAGALAATPTPDPALVKLVRRVEPESGSNSSLSVVSSPSSQGPRSITDVKSFPGRYVPLNVHGNRNISRVRVSASSSISRWPMMELLLPRADSCTTEPVCVCKGPYTTCLNIMVEEFHEFSVVFIVKVKENGKTTCEFKKQCDGCSGGDQECKDGNRFKWVHNQVWYYSKKEDYTFFGTLSNIQSTKYQCGYFGDCAGHSFSSDSNCKPNGH